MRQLFDFDNKIDESAQDNSVMLVPKETIDDKIEFLKQFSEYWDFEKKFKYNSTLDTTFKKVSKELSLDSDQMIDVVRELIGNIVGDAADAIGLDWKIINDGRYLFGFYKKGNDSIPVITVPYDFKFQKVKDKLIDWLVKEKKNEGKKKPKLQLIESLGKRARDKFAKDASNGKHIDSISYIDEKLFNSMINDYIKTSSLKMLDWDSYDAISMNEYACNPDTGDWVFPLFVYISDYNPDNNFTLALAFKFSDDKISIGIFNYLYEEERRSKYQLSDIEVESLFGDSYCTASSARHLIRLLEFVRARANTMKLWHLYDPMRLEDMVNDNSSSINQILDFESHSIEKVIGFLISRFDDIEGTNIDYVGEGFDYDSQKHHLGLNKRAKKSFNDTDAIDNVSQISFEDPEVERICHEYGVYTYGDARKVTSIDRWFYENDKIKSFNEFKYFTGLKEIENSAFDWCKSLQSINIPNSVTSIGNDAFFRCWSLQSINIPDSVTSIGEYAFYYCTSLQSINIPSSVTSIGDRTFYTCSSLQSINIPNSDTSIGVEAFYDCRSLKSINIPDSVTSIGVCAFDGCKSLQSINIPSSVTSIGGCAFDRCKSLQSIYISKRCPVYSDIEEAYPKIKLVDPSEVNEAYALGLNKHAKKAFNDTDAVENISQIPFEDKEVECICHEHGVYTYDDAREVTSIKGWFRNNNSDIKSFNELKFFSGLKEIEGFDFYYYTSLQSITIPDSVTSIGSHAFTGCKSLQSINIPDSVTSIGEWAFGYCNSLQSINIPDGVTSIKSDAFRDCVSLQLINIPDSVTNIGYQVFQGCKSLKEINIPDSVTNIGDWVFDGCWALKTIYISKDCPVYSNIKEEYSDIKLVDPSEMNETHTLGLNKRAKKTFNDTDTIDNVSQIDFKDPEVERICHEHGVYTYDDAASVTSIEGWFKENTTIESFNELKLFIGLKEIEEKTFYCCDSLQSINIPSNVTSIGEAAFELCIALKTIIIPDGVTNIGDYAFIGCKAFKSINIPSSITSIGNSAFYGCKSLKSINIPDGVASIRYQVFNYCKSLQSIDIPSSVTSIEKYAFYGCETLQSISIPDSVTSIGDEVFKGCSSLKTIYISKDCPVYSDIKEAYTVINLVDPSEMNEAHNLGLNKRAKKQHEEIDAVENISMLCSIDDVVSYIRDSLKPIESEYLELVGKPLIREIERRDDKVARVIDWGKCGYWMLIHLNGLRKKKRILGNVTINIAYLLDGTGGSCLSFFISDDGNDINKEMVTKFAEYCVNRDEFSRRNILPCFGSLDDEDSISIEPVNGLISIIEDRVRRMKE